MLIFLLDTSGSMAGERIQQLNASLLAFSNELQKDRFTSSHTEISIITFGQNVTVMPAEMASNFQPPHLLAEGGTPLGMAVKKALDVIQEWKESRQLHRESYYPPLVMLITDGEPTDDWQAIAARVRDEDSRKALTFLAVGIEGANLEVLSNFSRRNKPLLLKEANLGNLFAWTSKSVSVAANALLDQEVIALPMTWVEMQAPPVYISTEIEPPIFVDLASTKSEETMKKTLHLKMDGKAFQKGIYIHTVVDSLNELQFILDRSYLALVDKKNLTPKERTRYRLVAQSFEKGSFISAIDIVMATAPVVVPLISQIGPENIWEYTKLTFEFLKLVFTLNQEKKTSGDDKPINITGDGTTTNVNYGNQTWNFNAPVLVLGESVLPSYKRLSQLIKFNDIEFLQLGSGEKEPEIRLERDGNLRFDVKPELLKSPIALECEIFDINKDNGRGKLRVMKKQGVPSGEYNFVIAKSRKTKNKRFEFVQSMLEEKVIVECWKEILFDPFSPECTKIVKLHLLSVQTVSNLTTAS